MSDLQLRILTAKPPMMKMKFFISTDKALKHIRDHLLCKPEFKGWELLMNFHAELKNPELNYASLIGGVEFRDRASFSDQIYRNDPQNAQEIYNAYADIVEISLRQSMDLSWYAIHEDLMSAFSPLGILIYGNFNKDTGHWHCQTAYLPGLGSARSVLDAKDQESNHLLTREINIESDTITPRAILGGGRRRHRLEEEVKYRPQSLEERIFYEIYKISFKKIREKALNRPMVSTLSKEEEKIHQHDIKLYTLVNRLVSYEAWQTMMDQYKASIRSSHEYTSTPIPISISPKDDE
jgi:hypothetical protein